MTNYASQTDAPTSIDWKNHVFTYVILLIFLPPIGVLWGVFAKIYRRENGVVKKLPVYMKLYGVGIWVFLWYISTLGVRG